ncbi:hypothetical protein [Clostridium gasigenes]|uniref:Uncharacterized protein n=1 Tax=Clostridium gasigenes TaxID=94869 RepID=A0A7X0SBK3_9CLOT|nr:hypothetical protein [Clostridium gasigenes]MBB6714534.1 hypothetical protein [Clostridium gasigenes]
MNKGNTLQDLNKANGEVKDERPMFIRIIRSIKNSFTGIILNWGGLIGFNFEKGGSC